VGKRIAVRGTAKQTKINEIGDNHRPTGRYYFQTRISMRDAGQLRIL
jgi:hypothetical protein